MFGSISQIAVASKTLVWPELVVWLLILGGCALMEWRTWLKKKRELLEAKERRSPDTDDKVAHRGRAPTSDIATSTLALLTEKPVTDGAAN
jgi:hypothetical protein